MTLFLGHTRFSIDAYGSAWFNATRRRPSGLDLFSSREEYLDWLYDADRLERRARILIDWSLPQLHRAAQQAGAAGHRVRHVVSYSPTLPDAFQQQLRAAEERFEFLELHEADGVVDAFLPPEALTRQILGQEQLSAGEAFAAYRLDDDDVLSADYFSLVEPYVSEANVGFRVSMALGVSGLYRNGKLYSARETYYPKISMGMVSVCSWDEAGELVVPERYVDISQDNHDFADRAAPVITDARQPAFLRILHATQSGVLHRTRHLNRQWYSDAMSRIRHAPPADPADLAQKFPVLADALRTSHGEPEETVELLETDLVLGEDRVPFQVRMDGPFVLEVEFSSEEEAIGQDVAVKWQVEGKDGADVHSAEVVEHFTGSDVRHHRTHGYSTWVPAHRQYGAVRHCVVDVHPGARVTAATVLSRGKRGITVKQIRLTRI